MKQGAILFGQLLLIPLNSPIRSDTPFSKTSADEIRMHYSTILSGDRVMRSKVARDKISAQFHNALLLEMEAAGLMDAFPCLVIGGICDYLDSHKNKTP